MRATGKLRFGVLLAVSLMLAGCSHGRHRASEVAYVSAPQASLRDQVATMYQRVGNVKNGERVEILEREKRFARVRTASGIEGWIEQRYLLDQKTFDDFQKLTQSTKSDPVQAPGVLRNETNLHITPGRDSEHLYQLSSRAKVGILKRGTAEKALVTGSVPKPVSIRTSRLPSGPMQEDWWLVRDDQGRVGWVLSRMVDVDVPMEIAPYAEGQRFVAFAELDQVQDAEKKVPEYLCLLTEAHDGLPYDFDQVRVFTWNVRKHRYETAYREHGLQGVLPVKVERESFEKEGALPVFTVRVKDDAGNVGERKYKLNTPIVRRVLAPGEVASRAAHRKH